GGGGGGEGLAVPQALDRALHRRPLAGPVGDPYGIADREDPRLGACILGEALEGRPDPQPALGGERQPERAQRRRGAHAAGPEGQGAGEDLVATALRAEGGGPRPQLAE